jgi:hypothetical protein
LTSPETTKSLNDDGTVTPRGALGISTEPVHKDHSCRRLGVGCCRSSPPTSNVFLVFYHLWNDIVNHGSNKSTLIHFETGLALTANVVYR